MFFRLVKGADWRRLCIILVPCAGILAYLNSFSGVFLLDDHSVLRRSGFIVPERLQRILIDLTFAANNALAPSPAGYHAVNLAIHIIAALFLYGVLRRTFLKSAAMADVAAPAAAVAAAIWEVHPLQTQSVTYICQRYEAAMGMFAFATLYAFLRHLESRTSRSAFAWRVATAVFCAAGMASKEEMSVTPVVLFLYDVLFVANGWRKAWRERGKFHGLTAAAGWGTLALLMSVRFVLGGWESMSSAPTYSVSEYAASQVLVIMRYLRLSFWPHPLCFDYSCPPVSDLMSILVPGAAVGVLLVATVIGLARLNPVAFLGCWFFLYLAPTSSFLPLGDIAFEHRMYLALAAPVVGVVVAMWLFFMRFEARWRVAGGLGLAAAMLFSVMMIAILSLLTYRRNMDYLSAERMWRDVTTKRPHNIRAWIWLGESLLEERKLFPAEQAAGRALTLCTADGIGGGRLKLNPRLRVHHESLAWNLMGRVMLAQGRIDEAERCFAEATGVLPSNLGARVNMAYVAALKGRLEEAMKECERLEGMSLEEARPRVKLLKGAILLRQGKCREADAELREVVSGRGFEGMNARLLLAWLLATCADSDIRNGAEAVAIADTVFKEVGGVRNVSVLEVMAAALAETGAHEAAAEWQSKAIELRKNGRASEECAGEGEREGVMYPSLFRWDESLKAMEGRLQMYQRGLPYRERH